MRTRLAMLAVAITVLFQLPARAEVYHDPQGRFQIEVPAGWRAEPFGEGLKLARSGAYCLLLEAAGEGREALVKRLVKEFGAQWTLFQQLKEGTVRLSGQLAPYSFHSGVTPKGVATYLKVAAVSANGRTFAMIGSVPEKEFPEDKAGLEQMEQSFRIRWAAQR